MRKKTINVPTDEYAAPKNHEAHALMNAIKDIPTPNELGLVTPVVATKETDMSKPTKKADLPITDLIEEAITEQWGERCPDYDQDCPCCRAWQQMDSLVNLFEMVATLTLDHDECFDDEGESVACVFPRDLQVALRFVDPNWYNRSMKYGR